MKIVRLFIVAAILLGALFLVGGGLALAQDQGSQSLGAQQPEGRSVVRIYYPDREALDAISWELDIWEVHADEKYIVASVTPEKRQKIENLGYQVETDVAKTQKLLNPLAALDPRYAYFDDYFVNPNGLYIKNFMEDTNAAYPDLTELLDIGDAWQALHMGYHRDMWVLRITNEDPAYGNIADKPAFVLFANIHAREVSTPELAMRYIKYLTTGYLGAGGYGVDPDVTWLVNHNIAYILVTENPDGRVPNEQDWYEYRRKNMDNDDGCADPSSMGTDLNRNSSFFWNSGGSSGYPCDETYRGPTAGSEPEVSQFQDWIRTVIPDQNGDNGDYEYPPAAPITTTGIFISLHSYADLVLWPWGHTYNLPPNSEGLRTIGRKFANYNGFTPEQSINLYATSGTTDEYTYGKLGIPSYTFEVGDYSADCGDFFPDYDCIDGTGGASRNFWAENLPAFLFAHKIARSPYATSYGPDAQNVTVQPALIEPGDPADLNATINDDRYQSDPLLPISAAEYFFDSPGADGTGTPMEAVDGSFGETSEDVTAALDTSGLSTGKHYILVHGLNTSGYWGPFTAVFLDVMQPGVAPVIQGYVRDLITNAPLDAVVTAGVFSDTTDADGFYSMMVYSDTYDVTAEALDHLTGSVTVDAQDYQVINQDFLLQPLCAAFSDDVENGNVGWTASTPWAITTEASNSPTHSWTDSPGGNYSNNRNTSLTSQVFDLSGYTHVTLSFWHIYDIQASDYGRVEYSTDGGSTWTEAVNYTGINHDDAWTRAEVDLTALDGVAAAKIRFRFTSNGFTNADGWHIDDIRLSGVGGECGAPAAPTADFSSDSPVTLGEPMHFTNLTIGTPPLDFVWDFGDGVGTSIESDPVYTYTSAGTFTVTLTATNAQGSDSISKPVVVEPLPTPLDSVELTKLTPDPIYTGETVDFSADLAPDDATKPYTYTISFGDSITPTVGTSSDDPLSFSHLYATSGMYEVVFSAWNEGSAVPVTDSVMMEVFDLSTCTPLTSVTIDGPTEGFPGEYTFTLTYEPQDATSPSFLWDNGDTGESSTRTLEAGEHTISVTATNCDGVAVTDEHTILISELYEIYLPVIQH